MTRTAHDSTKRVKKDEGRLQRRLRQLHAGSFADHPEFARGGFLDQAWFDLFWRWYGERRGELGADGCAHAEPWGARAAELRADGDAGGTGPAHCVLPWVGIQR